MTSSVCISNCVNDTRVPVRATYVNLYKWPESDAEFVRSSVISRRNINGRQQQEDPPELEVYGGRHPRVVDSISCRQMYLRSYKFSRKETVPEKTQKWLGRVVMNEKVKVSHESSSFSFEANGTRIRRRRRSRRKRRKCWVLRKVQEISRAALLKIFHRFLSCSSSVDVLD